MTQFKQPRIKMTADRKTIDDYNQRRIDEQARKRREALEAYCGLCRKEECSNKCILFAHRENPSRTVLENHCRKCMIEKGDRRCNYFSCKLYPYSNSKEE